jgi:integrase/recombinase XerD
METTPTYLSKDDLLEAVRRVVREEIASAFQGKRESEASGPTTTLSQFAREYEANLNGRLAPNTMSTYLDAVKDLIRALGDVSIDSIDVKTIEKYLSTKQKETSDQTVRKHFGSLSSMFESSRKWGFISQNPFRALKKPRAREIQPAHFERAEFQKLLQLIPDNDFRDLCICGALTGMRQSELLALRWTDIDFAKKVILIQNSDRFTTKSRKNRVVPMHRRVCDLLKRRKDASSCDLVFHKNGQQLSRCDVTHEFKHFVRKAGLREDLHFHSLRHTFATWLVQNGVSIYEVQKLLGHSSIAVTQVYSHLASDELHEAVEGISLRRTQRRKRS